MRGVKVMVRVRVRVRVRVQVGLVCDLAMDFRWRVGNILAMAHN